MLTARTCQYCGHTSTGTGYITSYRIEVRGKAERVWAHAKCLRKFRNMDEVRIPQRFLQDHADRALPSPAVIRANAKHFWIRRDDPALAALLDDAKFYADRGAQDHDFGARALLAALATQGIR